MKNIRYTLLLSLFVGILATSCAASKETVTWMETTTVGSSPKAQYLGLKNTEEKLLEQIESLENQKVGASSYKQKRYDKQIDEIKGELGIVQRRMETFPESITNPDYIPNKTGDAEFREELDATIKQKIADRDPYSGAISNDSELNNVYKVFLKESGYIPLLDENSNIIESDNSVKYHVLFAITNSEISRSKLPLGGEILIQKLKNGQIAYYQGTFSTRAEADALCAEIASKTQYRDAFVVAMQNSKRIN